MNGADKILEQAFNDWLGGHFVEYYQGSVAFMGRVERMVLNYRGRIVSRDVADVRNSIIVVSQASSVSTPVPTLLATDATSIAKWGTRELRENAPVYLDATAAVAYRDNLLTALSQPRINTERVVPGMPQPGQLNVLVRGYVQSLDATLRTSASVFTDDADQEIVDTISGADFVTSGTINSNTFQVVEEVSNVPSWQRVKNIAKLGDSSGNEWLAGCYQGRALDYYQRDNTPYYRLDYKRSRLFVTDGYGSVVPPALVRPGRMAIATDIQFPTPDGEDLRLHFINRLVYDSDGLTFESERQDLRLTALRMAMHTIITNEPGGRK